MPYFRCWRFHRKRRGPEWQRAISTTPHSPPWAAIPSGIYPITPLCQACEEDLNARTAYTRSFKGKGAKADLVYSQSGYAAINIKNANGNWVPVDARLKPESNGRFSALSRHAPTAIDMASGYSSVKKRVRRNGFQPTPRVVVACR